MKNVIEEYRLKNHLSFAEIARRCRLDPTAVLRHCNGKRKISGEAVLRYHINLDIPLQELRPELFEQQNVMADTPL